MKKILALVLALCMVLALCACGSSSSSSSTAASSSSSSSSSNVVKIGVFEPQSGDNGAGGKQEVLGIQYANSVRPTVKVGDTEYTVELDIQDNQSSTDKAVSAAQQLISDGVAVVLGSYGSGVSIAAGTYFADAQVPAIGVSCTNAAVTAGNDWYFRVCFLDPFQGSVMANFAKDQFGAEKAYVLSMLGDDYTVGLAKNFVSAFEALGGEVSEDNFTEGTSDFSSYLQNAIDFGADVIFAPSATTYAAQIIEQANTKGIEMPILAGDTWESSVISDAQAATDGIQVYCSTFFDENDDSGVASEFVKGFKEYINGDSTNLTNNGGNDIVAAVSALGYDAYNVALDAIEAAGSLKGTDIQAALVALNGENYVTGAISFDENGDAKKDTAYIKQAIDSGFSFVKVQTAE